jgi:hypothetical protein
LLPVLVLPVLYYVVETRASGERKLASANEASLTPGPTG